MTFKIGRNRNTNDTATVSTVALNATTATTIAAANTDRIFLHISVEGTATPDVCVYVRLYAAATDNTKAGVMLGVNTSGNNNVFAVSWEMPTDNIYTGELSAILDSGTANVFITEY